MSEVNEMVNSKDLDFVWARWTEAMRDASTLIKDGKLTSALAAVDSFYANEEMPNIVGDILGFRANLKEILGQSEAAKQDLLVARALVGATYARYVHELSLSAICQKQNQLDEARSWYRTALRTCLEGKGISGGTALREFLSLQSEQVLTPDDRSLCAEVAEHSWRLLGLPGCPDLSNLARVVSEIKEGEAHPPKREPPY